MTRYKAQISYDGSAFQASKDNQIVGQFKKKLRELLSA